MLTKTTTTTSKLLVPLATLVAAGAVAVGSGATFSSEATDSVISATAGDLVHANDRDGATLSISNLKPGAVETGTITISNTGSLDGKLKVVVSNATGDLAGALQLKIESSDLTAAAYDNNFEDADVAAGFALGELDADPALTTADSITVTVTVRVEGDAGNTFQGDTAGMDLTFTTTQTDVDDETDSAWQ